MDDEFHFKVAKEAFSCQSQVLGKFNPSIAIAKAVRSLHYSASQAVRGNVVEAARLKDY
jgi:hypothetical protein